MGRNIETTLVVISDIARLFLGTARPSPACVVPYKTMQILNYASSAGPVLSHQDLM